MDPIADQGLAVTRGEATTMRCTVTDLPASGTAGWQVLGEFRLAPDPASAFGPNPPVDSWVSVQGTDFTIVTAGDPVAGTPAVVDVRFAPAQTLRLPAGARGAVFAAWETGSNLQIVQATWVTVRPQVR